MPLMAGASFEGRTVTTRESVLFSAGSSPARIRTVNVTVSLAPVIRFGVGRKRSPRMASVAVTEFPLMR